MRDETNEVTGPLAARPASSSPDRSSPTSLWRSALQRVGATGASLYGQFTERTLVWSLALYASVMVMLARAEPVLAQSGGGAVEGALQSAVDWLSNLITVAGTLGLMIAAVFWLFSGSDERKRQRATGWLATCALAIGVAFLAPELVDLISGWTGGPGGGGG